VGDIFGNPMNIALVVGVFAELSRELGVPMRFPGTDKAYRQLVQFTDSGLLARASVWAATDEKASGEVFNVTNGDVFPLGADVPPGISAWKLRLRCL
jgi:hypothetical protein